MSPDLPLSTAVDTNLDSFVLRFVVPSDPPASSVSNWHGVIRHVQSNRERAFVRWADAVEFIREFVDIAREPCDD